MLAAKITRWIMLFCGLVSYNLHATPLKDMLLANAKVSFGAEFKDLRIEHQNIGEYLTNCTTLQYDNSVKLELGKQYLRIFGCNHKKRVAITISAKVTMPIAKQVISKNTKITRNQLTTKDATISKKMKYFITFDALIGRTAKKQISAGKWVSAKSLKPDFFVEKGDLINFNVEQFGFIISTEMLARENGHLGQIIRIQHPVSKKKIKAVVTGKNQVSVIKR